MSTPPPIDYHPPKRNPNGVAVARFFAGLFVGLGLSALVWLLSYRSFDSTNAVLAVAGVVIVVKLITGILMQRSGRGAFLPGILVSIPLVPLITVGIVCGSMAMH